MSFQKKSSTGYRDALAGIRLKSLMVGERTHLVEFLLQKGSSLPLHSHPHEQTGYLVAGHMALTIGGVKNDVLPGDSWSVPGGTPHSAEAAEDSVAIEVFSPVREDYLPRA